MLKRTRLRRYLKALLYHDNIPQSPSCEVGFLFVNCDGERPPVFDSPTHQLYENAEGSLDFKSDSVVITFQVEDENLVLSPTRIESSDLAFSIDIIANASGGYERQNMLDEVQEKILYRILSTQSFIDASTNDELRSFMLWLNQNELSVSIRDDTEFDGSTTVRRMSFTLSTNECIKKTGCTDEPLCFDFSQEKIGGCNG